MVRKTEKCSNNKENEQDTKVQSQSSLKSNISDMKIAPEAMLMKAVLRTSLFGFSTDFKETIIAPSSDKLSPDHIIVKVEAAGINPIDFKLPRIAAGKGVGIDFSGTVTAVGRDVTDTSIGDDVFGAVLEEGGSLAEYTTVRASHVAKKPEWIDFPHAAALPVAYTAALQGLSRYGKLPQHGSVLIIGASGGAGLAACQLSKAMGASRIVGICSKRNTDLIKKQGATETVDYKNDEVLQAFFRENKSKFDVVLDCASYSGKGENYTKDSIPLLKATGQYVQLNAPAKDIIKTLMFHRNLGEQQTFFDSLQNVNRKDLEDSVSLLHKVHTRPIITTMSFNEIAVRKGYEKLQSRRVRGKIVFDVAAAASRTNIPQQLFLNEASMNFAHE